MMRNFPPNGTRRLRAPGGQFVQAGATPAGEDQRESIARQLPHLRLIRRLGMLIVPVVFLE